MDVSAIREDFPILTQQVNHKPLVYLDNAASAHKPRQVIDTISHYYMTIHSNVHRGAHTLADYATSAFENSRKTVQRFVNAPSSDQIVWVKGTTEAINLIANGCTSMLGPGDEVIISAMEHHANIVPWQMLCERTGAQLKIIGIDDNGELDLSHFESLLGPQTKILAITHVSNVLGTRNPVEEIMVKAKAYDVLTVIDGAQAVPHKPVDVQDLDCDFYAFSSHKLFGPTGIGVLYGKRAKLEALPPYQFGGEMIERVTFEKTTFNTLPYKFEAGTPAIAEAIGLAAAIDYLGSLDRCAIDAHENTLLTQSIELSQTIPGMRLIGTASDKVPVLSFLIDGLHPSDIGTLLDQQGIAIRTGHHCAMPLMQRLAIPGTARASFAFYNTMEEVEVFFKALAKIQRMFT
ncbi:MAG: cysteine desulfurase CsdA [Gammaproteobacteria bacterium]|nr:MAG: cysteine desulfurase CsdA [Gammaproteobacteria bacterium]